jgi:peroxiredoxin
LIPVLPPKGRPPLSPGDPAPDFTAAATNTPAFTFSTAAGRYLVLCFLGTAGDPRSLRTIEAVAGLSRAAFDDHFAALFGVTLDPADEAERRLHQVLPGIRQFWDFDGEVTRLYTGRQGPIDPAEMAREGFTLVVDPFMRVLANIPFSEPGAHGQAVAALLRSLPPPQEHAGPDVPAPVLVLPRVFEPELCRTLIDLYEERGGGDSGFMREQDGQTVGVLDYTFKRRRDFRFDDGEEFDALREAVKARMSRRLIPAIRQVFHFPVTRMERYIVACYDADEGGYFRPHRDNTTAATAHRRFAVTINLNAEEYEGGDLSFPEFGSRTYRAPTGGAVVFSCGLLHEATPVTRGRRYACLPFLYDEAAARVRDRNRHLLSEQIIDNTGRAAPVAAGADVS